MIAVNLPHIPDAVALSRGDDAVAVCGPTSRPAFACTRSPFRRGTARGGYGSQADLLAKVNLVCDFFAVSRPDAKANGGILSFDEVRRQAGREVNLAQFLAHTRGPQLINEIA